MPPAEQQVRVTSRQMSEMLLGFCRKSWPVLVNPPELNINVEMSAAIKGFDHLGLQMRRIVTNPGPRWIKIKGIGKDRYRFIRRFHICVRQHGKPFDRRRPDLISWMKSNASATEDGNRSHENSTRMVGT